MSIEDKVAFKKGPLYRRSTISDPGSLFFATDAGRLFLHTAQGQHIEMHSDLPFGILPADSNVITLDKPIVLDTGVTVRVYGNRIPTQLNINNTGLRDVKLSGSTLTEDKSLNSSVLLSYTYIQTDNSWTVNGSVSDQEDVPVYSGTLSDDKEESGDSLYGVLNLDGTTPGTEEYDTILSECFTRVKAGKDIQISVPFLDIAPSEFSQEVTNVQPLVFNDFLYAEREYEGTDTDESTGEEITVQRKDEYLFASELFTFSGLYAFTVTIIREFKDGVLTDDSVVMLERQSGDHLLSDTPYIEISDSHHYTRGFTDDDLYRRLRPREPDRYSKSIEVYYSPTSGNTYKCDCIGYSNVNIGNGIYMDVYLYGTEYQDISSNKSYSKYVLIARYLKTNHDTVASQIGTLYDNPQYDTSISDEYEYAFGIADRITCFNMRFISDGTGGYYLNNINNTYIDFDNLTPSAQQELTKFGRALSIGRVFDNTAILHNMMIHATASNIDDTFDCYICSHASNKFDFASDFAGVYASLENKVSLRFTAQSSTLADGTPTSVIDHVYITSFADILGGGSDAYVAEFDSSNQLTNFSGFSSITDGIEDMITRISDNESVDLYFTYAASLSRSALHRAAFYDIVTTDGSSANRKITFIGRDISNDNANIYTPGHNAIIEFNKTMDGGSASYSGSIRFESTSVPDSVSSIDVHIDADTAITSASIGSKFLEQLSTKDAYASITVDNESEYCHGEMSFSFIDGSDTVSVFSFKDISASYLLFVLLTDSVDERMEGDYVLSLEDGRYLYLIVTKQDIQHKIVISDQSMSVVSIDGYTSDIQSRLNHLGNELRKARFVIESNTVSATILPKVTINIQIDGSSDIYPSYVYERQGSVNAGTHKFTSLPIHLQNSDSVEVWKFDVVTVLESTTYVTTLNNIQKISVPTSTYISQVESSLSSLTSRVNNAETAPSSGSTNLVTSGGVFTAIQTAETNAINIAQGKTKTRVFATVAALNSWIDSHKTVDTSTNTNIVTDDSGIVVKNGDIFLIIATDVPDYWWDDQTLVDTETIKGNLRELEVRSIDLSGYLEESEIDSKVISAKGVVTGRDSNDALTNYIIRVSDTAPAAGTANNIITIVI